MHLTRAGGAREWLVRSLAIQVDGRHDNVGGVTAGKARHNSSIVRGVTAGKEAHNSSNDNNNKLIFTWRSFLSQLKALHIKGQSNLMIKKVILNNKSST